MFLRFASDMIQTIITLATAFSTILTVILLFLPRQYGVQATPLSTKDHQSEDPDQKVITVQILVLGDLGRSPRMQYHALSIAKHGGSVQLIGYVETEPLPELRALNNVRIVPLSASPKFLQTTNRTIFLAVAPLKVLYQVWNLWLVLGYKTDPSKWLLVQNPPSIPTLVIASVVCFLRHTRLVIDWHNFGHSILALKLGHSHPFVRVSRLYEKVLARTAHNHFAVTNVMASLLQAEYVSSAPVMPLHDRPAPLFQPMLSSDRVAFLSGHSLTSAHCEAIIKQRSRLVVSSTSWTADEDFDVLLRALCLYSAEATLPEVKLPKIFVVITGKGPQKLDYVDKITNLKQEGKLEMVTIVTDWLSFEDYASLLAAADLGVSLHTSSSGVDLPMKVVDMFGAGLPVLGFDDFKAWPELVTEGVNGLGFANAEQMSTILQKLFDPGDNQLQALRQGALQESRRRWATEWDPVAGRLFGLVR